MKVSYDFHIHTALSPCSDDGMTPCNIAAAASLKGLNAIAVTDHNAIANSEAVAEVCNLMGIVTLYGVEVQTAEDIHVLALFEEYQKLKEFFATLRFPAIKNRPDIFGRQLIIDSNDEIVGEEERLLTTSCDEGIYTVCKRILDMEGKAIPAHIDREANGILSILGAVPPDLRVSALEFSPYASTQLRAEYAAYRQIVNSDSHCLDTLLGGTNTLEAKDTTPRSVFSAI